MNRSTFTLILISLATIGYSEGGSPANEHCDDPLICVEKPEIYDTYQEHMTAIVKNNEELLLTKRSVDEFDEPLITGDAENCWAVTTVEKPYVIKTNVSSEFVVQVEKFEQKIRVTRCRDIGSACFENINVPGFGWKTFCQEKLGSISLYIYDPNYKQMQNKIFTVPVCCSCVYIQS